MHPRLDAKETFMSLLSTQLSWRRRPSWRDHYTWLAGKSIKQWFFNSLEGARFDCRTSILQQGIWSLFAPTEATSRGTTICMYVCYTPSRVVGTGFGEFVISPNESTTQQNISCLITHSCSHNSYKVVVTRTHTPHIPKLIPIHTHIRTQTRMHTRPPLAIWTPSSYLAENPIGTVFETTLLGVNGW